MSIAITSLAAALFIIVALIAGVYVAFLLAALAVLCVVAFYVGVFIYVLWVLRARPMERDRG